MPRQLGTSAAADAGVGASTGADSGAAVATGDSAAPLSDSVLEPMQLAMPSFYGMA